MGAINVLVVGDGPFMDNSPPQDGINFAPSQDLTDDTFTVSEFLYLLRNSTAPAIAVKTAHRRNDPNANYPNFTFTPASIAEFDVLWLFGYEGWNYQSSPPPGGYLSDSEVAAITAFMDAGGGVFATGDHAGMGSYMCGRIPRVRTMRKWFSGATGATTPLPRDCRDPATGRLSDQRGELCGRHRDRAQLAWHQRQSHAPRPGRHVGDEPGR